MKIQCAACHSYAQRPGVSPYRLGLCCTDRFRPRVEPGCVQPKAPDKQQGRWPFEWVSCRSFQPGGFSVWRPA